MFGIKEAPAVNPCHSHAFPWGEVTHCASLEGRYALERIDLPAQKTLPLHFYLEREGVYYVEEGRVQIRSPFQEGRIAQKGQTFSFAKGDLLALHAAVPTTLFLFSNEGTMQEARFAEEEALPPPSHCSPLTSYPFDRREKYWGEIETIVSREFAGKRIAMEAHGQSSLEFHCCKTESYYLLSGLLKVGLRLGRAHNTAVTLHPGESFTIPPGLMHMRIALETSVLIEISTHDSDLDSHLVEDGRSYQHKESA